MKAIAKVIGRMRSKSNGRASTASASFNEVSSDQGQEQEQLQVGIQKKEKEIEGPVLVENYASPMKSLTLYSSISVYDREEIAFELANDYDLADLVIGIAAKYFEVMKPNAGILVTDLPKASRAICGKQRYSSVAPHFYLTRMIRMLNEIYDRHDPSRTGLKSTGIQILMMATIYIDRLLETRKDFILHPVNLYRVFFGGVIAAIKFTEDLVPDKHLMSMIGGGLSPAQTKQCESCFCALLGFNFWIDPDTALQHQFDKFCPQLLYLRHIVPKFIPASEPISS